MDTEVIQQEINRLYPLLSSAIEGGFDITTPDWYLYIKPQNSPWPVGEIYLVHQRSGFYQWAVQRVGLPGYPHLTGPESLATLIAYLPLIPLETGILILRNPSVCGPLAAAGLRTEALGIESYKYLIESGSDGRMTHILRHFVPSEDGAEQISEISVEDTLGDMD